MPTKLQSRVPWAALLLLFVTAIVSIYVAGYFLLSIPDATGFARVSIRAYPNRALADAYEPMTKLEGAITGQPVEVAWSTGLRKWWRNKWRAARIVANPPFSQVALE